MPLIASQLRKEVVLRHLRLDPDYIDEQEWIFIESLVRAANAYIRDHCDLTQEYIDEHEDLAIAVLVLTSDMYDQRSRYVDSVNDNRTLMTILSHHDMNMVG